MGKLEEAERIFRKYWPCSGQPGQGQFWRYLASWLGHGLIHVVLAAGFVIRTKSGDMINDYLTHAWLGDFWWNTAGHITVFVLLTSLIAFFLWKDAPNDSTFCTLMRRGAVLAMAVWSLFWFAAGGDGASEV